MFFFQLCWHTDALSLLNYGLYELSVATLSLVFGFSGREFLLYDLLRGISIVNFIWSDQHFRLLLL